MTFLTWADILALVLIMLPTIIIIVVVAVRKDTSPKLDG